MSAIPLPVHHIKRVRRAPDLDPRLADPLWKRAEPILLRENTTGEAPVQPTEVRLLYDAECLYAAFHCVDDDVWGTYTHRDDIIYWEEVVEIFIDCAGNRRSYIELEVSPLNTIIDLYVLNDPRCPPLRTLEGWNCEGMRTAVHIERNPVGRTPRFLYWNAVLAVPFNQMHDAPNLPPRRGDRWNLNLYRIDRGRKLNEHSAWSPTLENAFHRPARFGTVVFD